MFKGVKARFCDTCVHVNTVFTKKNKFQAFQREELSTYSILKATITFDFTITKNYRKL